MSEPRPLHDLSPTTRFTDRASDYVRYRPSYPAAMIDAVLAGLAPPRTLRAVDVGAGTGISARLLADRGVRVTAVEPNEAMRRAADPHPLVEWRAGTAEATGLEPGSADLVLCAQAFHWFRHRESLAEFHRVLRPRGRLVLAWNRRDASDPLTEAYTRAIRDAGGDHPAELMAFDPASLTADGLFDESALFVTPCAQRLDEDGLIGRAMSASYVPKQGPASEGLVRTLRALHTQHAGPDGMVRLRYRTEAHITHRR